MKKIFALALVVAMMLSMSVVAMAATLDLDPTNTSTQSIVITNNTTDDTATKVYSVDVSWTDTEISLNSTMKWNPETHAYDIVTGTTIDDANKTASVKVINHSNAVVNAAVTTDHDGSLFKITCDAAADLADASLVAPGTPNDEGQANTKIFGIAVDLADGITELSGATYTFNATVTITK